MAKKRSSRPMRLPNGFGSIVHLSGNRRNPYMARPPVTDYFDNGSPITPKAIGYYPDWHSAYEALLEYRRNPYDVDGRRLTFAEVYDLMIADRKKSQRGLSKSNENSLRAGFKNAAALHKMQFSDVRLSHIQGVMDDCPLKHSSVELILNVIRQMYAFALKYDIAQKDYSEFAAISQPEDDESGVPFSPEELRILWSHTNDPIVQATLVLCYSGWRVSEAEQAAIDLDTGVFRGGLKTRAGRNRIVPIHPAIRNMAEALYSPGGGILGYRAQRYRVHLKSALESLDLPFHTPHDCRHTFSWLCDHYGVDDMAKRMMLGHSLGNDVTDKVYGHRTPEELRQEIEKIQVPLR